MRWGTKRAALAAVFWGAVLVAADASVIEASAAPGDADGAAVASRRDGPDVRAERAAPPTELQDPKTGAQDPKKGRQDPQKDQQNPQTDPRDPQRRGQSPAVGPSAPQAGRPVPQQRPRRDPSLSSDADESVRKKRADLPPPEQRLLVSNDGFRGLTFATPCEPDVLASVVEGGVVETVAAADPAAGTGAVYEVRQAWEPLFRAEAHPATGHIDRLVIWSQNAITPAGVVIGQSFERASLRTRRDWFFETGKGEFSGALIGTLSDEPYLHYVFAPVSWQGATSDPLGASEPEPHWEVKAFIWTAD